MESRFIHSRYGTGPESTISRLWHLVERTTDPFVCYLLEDQYQPGAKVPGETCIPVGGYDVALVHDSPMALRYAERLDWFRGLPTMVGVPGFDGIRIHCGNDDGDTEGCPLTGSEAIERGPDHWGVARSAEALKRLCVHFVYPAFDRGDHVRWIVTDHELAGRVEAAVRRAQIPGVA